MINEKEVTRISKYLSLVLRHKPETIGITLDEQGWTDVRQLLNKMNEHTSYSLDINILDHIVKTNNKSRFIFNADRSKIKANQGHSVKVMLDLAPQEPPELLYHGTAQRFINSIFQQGLQKQNRHHVHLTACKETAMDVGRRYGKPVLFCIRAGEMNKQGHLFYKTENNVWLTDHVPVEYLQVVDEYQV